MKPHATPLLLLGLLVAGCARAVSFPVPSVSHESPQGFAFDHPEKGIIEEFAVHPPQVAAGRVRGAAKMDDGELIAYTVRYALTQTSERYPARIVLDVQKGRCLLDGCSALREETRSQGRTRIVRQLWPDENDTVLHVVMLQRGERILKLTWSTPSAEEENVVAEAIAASATLAEPPAIAPEPTPVEVEESA